MITFVEFKLHEKAPTKGFALINVEHIAAVGVFEGVTHITIAVGRDVPVQETYAEVLELLEKAVMPDGKLFLV